MECNDVVTRAIERLADAGATRDDRALDMHLESCAACRAEVEAAENACERLGADPDATIDPAFRRATLAMLEAETLRRRVVPLRSRVDAGAPGAATLVTGVGNRPRARASRPGRLGPASTVPSRPGGTIDADRSIPDLSRPGSPTSRSSRRTRPAGSGSSFDVTTRYTVVGKPNDKGVSDVLAYMVSGSGANEGARGKAIDLVSQHYAGETPVSPQIVATLADTLRHDKNPGVRKKAAEALAQMPPTPEIRDAFLVALKSDTNPAVRIVAVEALANAATNLRDPAAIETLREKANDDRETGYVRVKAAKALQRINL
jgi:hypothetical protein